RRGHSPAGEPVNGRSGPGLRRAGAAHDLSGRRPRLLDADLCRSGALRLVPGAHTTAPGALTELRTYAPIPRAIAVATNTIATTSTACTTLMAANVPACRVSTSPRDRCLRQRIRVVIGQISSRRISPSSPIFSQKAPLLR